MSILWPDAHGAKWWRVPAGPPTCAGGVADLPLAWESPASACAKRHEWGPLKKKKKPNLPSEGTKRGVAGRGVAGWTTVCVGELRFHPGIPKAPLGGRHLARRMVGDGLPLRHVRRACVAAAVLWKYRESSIFCIQIKIFFIYMFSTIH